MWYFGELVDNYENGQFKDHNGQWLSGEGTNQPGIMMPATPELGRTYRQENAPGIAEDEATVQAIDAAVNVPTGSYTGCLKTRDVNPLDPEALVESKFYCPGVGLAREEAEGELLELVEVKRAVATPPAAPPVTAPAAGSAPASQAVPVIAPNAGDGSAQTGGSALIWLMVAAAGVAGATACSVALRMRRVDSDR